MFVRDSGPGTAQRGAVLLLHGWMFPSDLNWFACYQPLIDAGYRVVATDARGHGRGLRSTEPFRLDQCADDTARLIRHLDLAPVDVVGYSMGGAIAQVMAYRYPELVDGIVLCATSLQWRDRVDRRLFWASMGLFQLYLRLFDRRIWFWLLRRVGVQPRLAHWIVSELERGSAYDIAEAGREIGRFDSRSWIGAVAVPAAVVVTTRDSLIPPRDQYEIAVSIDGATVHEVRMDHGGVVVVPERFLPVLLDALESVRRRGMARGARVIKLPPSAARRASN
jgi:pimeloyl-ACP methyl ester carboxylesterase